MGHGEEAGRAMQEEQAARGREGAGGEWASNERKCARCAVIPSGGLPFEYA